MSTTINLHDVGREAYEAIDVPESKGPTHLWKVLYVGETKLTFFPGAWRTAPRDTQVEEAAEGAPVLF